MIYILHGNDISAIRDFIVKLHNKAETISSKTEFLIEETSPQEVESLVTSVDMFGGSPLVLLDITNKGRTKLDDYIEVLCKVPYDKALVIVFSAKKLRKNNPLIKKANDLDARVREFEKPDDSEIFNFVDRVFEGNRKASYKELQKLILSEKNEFYIFSMMLYGLKNVAYAKFNSPLYKKMHPYVRSKSLKQASNFTEQNILDLYDIFYDLDLRVKTGRLNSDILIPLAIEKVLTYI